MCVTSAICVMLQSVILTRVKCDKHIRSKRGDDCKGNGGVRTVRAVPKCTSDSLCRVWVLTLCASSVKGWKPPQTGMLDGGTLSAASLLGKSAGWERLCWDKQRPVERNLHCGAHF
jgi:hypothetical protein